MAKISEDFLKKITSAFFCNTTSETHCSKLAMANLFAVGCYFSMNGNEIVGDKLRRTALMALYKIDKGVEGIVIPRGLSNEQLKELAIAVKPHKEVADLFEKPAL